jgi:ubiquinone biosynthesis accessory factor UbiJ
VATVSELIDRALKAAVDRARADSPRARTLLTSLAGQRVTLVAQGTPWALTLESNGTELRISQEKAETTISGTPLSLLALMREQPQTLIQRGDLRIEGDTDTAQQFGELALLLRPDLEHALSSVLGRSGAHVLMQGLRETAAWTRETAWTAVQNLSEYLAHERGDLVSRAEAEHFLRGVDAVREQLDRIEARVTQLDRNRKPA